MDFKLTDEQVAQRDEFFQVCRELEKKKPPSFYGLESVWADNEGWEFHRYCAKEFAKRGWLSLGWPAEYGGHGTIMDRVFLAEARGYYDIPGVDVFGVGMLAPTLLAAGSEEVKRRFLPGIASGDTMWCELWSEPNAGSDLASLTTTAIRKGDEYVINGQKTWNSGAHWADWAFGVFKTDLKAKKRHNLSFLLLDMKTPGVTVNPIEYMDGAKLYAEVFLDDVHIPTSNIVGAEGNGWEVTQLLAGFERSGIDAIMGMQRQLEELVKYCNETKVEGGLLARNQIIRNRLAEIACEIEADRTLAYRIADLQSRNAMVGFDASIVKVFTGELLERLSFLGAELLGPYGQIKFSRWAPQNGAWEKACQESFVFTIAMGTDEIQKNIMAWYGLGLPRMF